MNENYSNRELDRMFKELQDEMSASFLTQKDQLNRIESQTMRTNGRVSSLERWRTGIIMSLSVVVALVGVLSALAVYAYQSDQAAQTAKLEVELKK